VIPGADISAFVSDSFALWDSPLLWVIILLFFFGSEVLGNAVVYPKVVRPF